MARKPLSLIPPHGVHTEAPTPKPVTITMTAEQVEGIKARQVAVNAATMDLNSFIGGIVTGHGHSAVQVSGFNAEKRTLTFTPVRVEKPVDNS